MARIDDTLATYLTAIEVENKRPRTIDSYAESFEDFRRIGRRLGLPDAVEETGRAPGGTWQLLAEQREDQRAGPSLAAEVRRKRSEEARLTAGSGAYRHRTPALSGAGVHDARTVYTCLLLRS